MFLHNIHRFITLSRSNFLDTRSYCSVHPSSRLSWYFLVSAPWHWRNSRAAAASAKLLWDFPRSPCNWCTLGNSLIVRAENNVNVIPFHWPPTLTTQNLQREARKIHERNWRWAEWRATACLIHAIMSIYNCNRFSCILPAVLPFACSTTPFSQLVHAQRKYPFHFALCPGRSGDAGKTCTKICHGNCAASIHASDATATFGAGATSVWITRGHEKRIKQRSQLTSS